MNTTEKFQKLVSVATENGWCNLLFEDYETDNERLTIYLGNPYCPEIEISINDIILNYENDETSFIEALCRANQKAVSQYQGFIFGDKQPPYTYLTILWEYDITTKKLRPTSQRLDWLFDTFKHLL